MLAGRQFDSIADWTARSPAWLPIRRAQAHRTHGQVIAVRAEADRAALRPLPAGPTWSPTGTCAGSAGRLISFEASLYSVPARKVRPGQRVSVQIHPDPTGTVGGGATVVIHALGADGGGSPRPVGTHGSVRGAAELGRFGCAVTSAFCRHVGAEGARP